MILSRTAWIVVGGVAAILVALVGYWAVQPMLRPAQIVVGILHSKTGVMTISERAVIDAEILALEQINERGGLLGRPIRWVIADGKSDEAVFAYEAERLITQERVAVIFGCWTSASRKAVKPVVEKRDHLLVYPVQYEGCEASPNILYLGAAPNQQIIPAVAWSLENLGKRLYLVGSDYIFPRVANEIIKQQARALGAEIVGESYLPLEAFDVDRVVTDLIKAKPDAVLNTINGDANVHFFRALARLGAKRSRLPVVSFSIGETELRTIDDRSALRGHYAAWNYFQTVDRPENAAFVAAFRKRFGADRVVSDPMEAAYCGVQLWARAVQEAGTDQVSEVRTALRQQSLDAPEGLLSVDPDTQHVWKTVRIGQIDGDGQFTIVWSSRHPIRPMPFPISQVPSAWEAMVEKLYRGWGGRWSNPNAALRSKVGIGSPSVAQGGVEP